MSKPLFCGETQKRGNFSTGASGEETRSCKIFPLGRKYFFIQFLKRNSENSINSGHFNHCSHFSRLCGTEILRNSKYGNSVRCRGWMYQRMTCAVCNAYHIRLKKIMINIRTCNTKPSQGPAFFATRSTLTYICTFSLLTIKLGIAITVSWFCSPFRRRNWRNVNCLIKGKMTLKYRSKSVFMGGKQERLIRLAKVQFINKPSIKLWNVSWPRELIVNSNSEQFSIGCPLYVMLANF